MAIILIGIHYWAEWQGLVPCMHGCSFIFIFMNFLKGNPIWLISQLSMLILLRADILTQWVFRFIWAFQSAELISCKREIGFGNRLELPKAVRFQHHLFCLLTLDLLVHDYSFLLMLLPIPSLLRFCQGCDQPLFLTEGCLWQNSSFFPLIFPFDV